MNKSVVLALFAILLPGALVAEESVPIPKMRADAAALMLTSVESSEVIVARAYVSAAAYTAMALTPECSDIDLPFAKLLDFIIDIGQSEYGSRTDVVAATIAHVAVACGKVSRQ